MRSDPLLCFRVRAAAVIWGVQKRPGQWNRACWLARAEAVAVLGSLLFLICPLLFLLPLHIPQRHPATGVLLLQTPPHTCQPYHFIAQKRPLASVMPRERAATHTGPLLSLPVLVAWLGASLSSSRPGANLGPPLPLCLPLSAPLRCSISADNFTDS